MRLLSPFCFFAFFLSGFSALVYELTWTRLLKQIFGSDSFAFAAILIVFIGGIAFGSYLAASLISGLFRFDNQKEPKALSDLNLGQSTLLLAFYGITELILALYCCFVPFILDTNNFQDLWIGLANLSLDNNMLAILIKLILGLLLLLLPTTLIGFGLPVLSELLVMHQNSVILESRSDSGTQSRGSDFEKINLIVSNLYATNTLGAICGTVFTGFILLPKIGLQKTILLAVLLNLISFLLVFVVIFINRHLFADNKLKHLFTVVVDEAKKIHTEMKSSFSSSISEVKNSDSYKKYKFVNLILIIIAALIGFINLGLELVWTKVLALVIGSSTYSLTIVLTVVLLGITVGAYLLNYFLQLSHRFKIDYLNFLKITLSAFALLIALSFVFLNNLPTLFITINKLLPLPVNLLKFIYVSLIYLPVTLVEGLIYAFILFLVASGTNLVNVNVLEPVGTRVARVTLFNTLGAITGAFLIAFVLMPLFSNFGSGIYFSMLFLTLVAFAAAFLTFALEEVPVKFSKWQISILFAVMTVALLLIRQPIPELFSSGVGIYSGLKFKNKSAKDFNKSLGQEILFHKEGLNYVITVVKDTGANAILLKSNGKVEAGIPLDYSKPSKADLGTQVLLGLLPVAIKPDAESALLIGMGSGVSLESLALTAKNSTLKYIDVCEIEKVIFEAADKFFVKKYPAGIKINRKNTDARNFLLAKSKSQDKYDLIISQPSDPWISASLFTKEFWSLASDNLSDNGIFVQWLQLYSIDPEYLTITLRTFQSIFDEVVVFKPENSAELILIGSNNRIKLDIPKVKTLINENEALRKRLVYIGIEDEADFLASLVLAPNSVRALITASFPKEVEQQKEEEVKSPGTIKPTLSKANLTTAESNFSDFKTNGKLNLLKVTDDNMLLEFHTYSKLNAFAESIQSNLDFITKYSSPEFLIKFLVESGDNDFLLRLAASHLKVNNYENKKTELQSPAEFFSNLHAKLALGLAEYIHEFTLSPQSYMTLIEIYNSSNHEYKARDLAFDALFQLSGYFNFNSQTNQPELKGFNSKSSSLLKDSQQFFYLAKIFKFNQDYYKANEIIDKAIAMLNALQVETLEESYKDQLLSQFYQEKAEIEFAILEKNLHSETYDMFSELQRFKQIDSSLTSSLKYNKLNHQALVVLAKLDLEKIKLYPYDEEALKTSAIKLLKQSQRLSPNIYEANLLLGEVYLKTLPDSQLKFMAAVNTSNPDPVITKNLDLAILYVHNALQIKPYAVRANYYMLTLQNLMGNLDNAFKHSQRLEKICGKEFAACQDKLSEEEIKKAIAISVKLSKLVQ